MRMWSKGENRCDRERGGGGGGRDGGAKVEDERMIQRRLVRVCVCVFERILEYIPYSDHINRCVFISLSLLSSPSDF